MRPDRDHGELAAPGASGATGAASGPLGVLAGGGPLPVRLAEAARRDGRAVHIVGLIGEADGGIEAHPHTWVPWGAVGRLVAAFEQAGCRQIVIAGRVRRPDLTAIRPDLGFFTNLPRLLRLLQGGDDSVLTRVVRFFESKGLTVVGAHQVDPELVVGEGALGSFSPTPEASTAIFRGFAVVDALGPFDVGQAAVVAGDRVLAVEGAEGTDAMLERVAGLVPRLGSPAGGATSGGVLVKEPKPGQELRIDMPAIGPRTLELAIAAGLTGLAIAAGRVLVLERAALLAAAERAGAFVVGARVASSAKGEAPARQRRKRWRFRGTLPEHRIMAGTFSPRRDGADLAKALATSTALAPHGAGRALVVSRQYVLAVGGAETSLDVIRRAGGLKQWGRWLGRQRRGLVALRGTRHGEAFSTLVEAACETGLAGLVLHGDAIDAAIDAASLDRAKRHGLFVVAAPFAEGRVDVE
jgi:DUF1009 family protein